MLFEVTCDERWFNEATTLADTLVARFADSERGGFYSTASDAGEPLIARRKDLEDTPIPAGQSSAAMGLLRLVPAHRQGVRAPGARVLALLRDIAPRHPTSFGHALQALHWHFAPPARPIACTRQSTESTGTDPAPTA